MRLIHERSLAACETRADLDTITRKWVGSTMFLLCRVASISFLVLLVLGRGSPRASGAEIVFPSAGLVVGPSGRSVAYESHIARNSLKASLRVHGSTIAITSAGTIMIFDIHKGSIVCERGGGEIATCLGSGEGRMVVVGLADGRVCRIDLKTLGLVELAKVTGTPVWVGWNSANGGGKPGVVVLTSLTRPGELFGQFLELPYVKIHDLATGWSSVRPGEVTACMLDRQGSLWLGLREMRDHGSVVRVNIARKTCTTIAAPPTRDRDDGNEQHSLKFFWTSVRGFLEQSNGAIWAYGGTSSRGHPAGRIARVDTEDGVASSLYLGVSSENERKTPMSDRPIAPITHMLADEDERRLLVFSHNDVFRTDKALMKWEKIAALSGLHGRWGRPAEGDEAPSIVAVHPPDRDGAPYTMATAFDGYVVWDGTQTGSRALAGQLGLASVERIENTTEGTLFFDANLGILPQTLSKGVWSVAIPPSAFAETGVRVEPPSDGTHTSQLEALFLVGPSGEIFTVSYDYSTALVSTIRWRNKKPQHLGTESINLGVSSSFITADCKLWNASRRVLRRFEGHRWVKRSQLPIAMYGIDMRCLNNAHPWVLLNRGDNALWSLTPEGKDRLPELVPIEVRHEDRLEKIRAGISQPDGTLLLATDTGLRVYDPTMRQIREPKFPQPPIAVNDLAWDGSTRLWVGSDEGLFMLNTKTSSWESFEYVPWLRRNRIEALKRDPQRPDGVIIALGSQGVLFLRAIPGR